MSDDVLDQDLRAYHRLLDRRFAAGTRRRLPNVIGVGAPRCGTSSLYRCLRGHPGIFMSDPKELNHFGCRDRTSHPRGATLDEYATYFLGAGDEGVVGECSPCYLSLPTVPRLIRRALGKVRIIIGLRDPAARFVSQFAHHRQQHGQDDLAAYVATALEAYHRGELAARRYDWYHPVKNLAQSLYADGVRSFRRVFGEERVLVYFQEDLETDGPGLLREIYRFLEVDPDQGVALDRLNASPAGANRTTDDLVHTAPLRPIFRQDVDRLRRLVSWDYRRWASLADPP